MENISPHEKESNYFELKAIIDASPFGDYFYERVDKPDKIGIKIEGEIPKAKFDEMVKSLPVNVEVFSNIRGTVGTNLTDTADGVIESAAFSSLRSVNPTFYLR